MVRVHKHLYGGPDAKGGGLFLTIWAYDHFFTSFNVKLYNYFYFYWVDLHFSWQRMTTKKFWV